MNKNTFYGVFVILIFWICFAQMVALFKLLEEVQRIKKEVFTAINTPAIEVFNDTN